MVRILGMISVEVVLLHPQQRLRKYANIFKRRLNTARCRVIFRLAKDSAIMASPGGLDDDSWLARQAFYFMPIHPIDPRTLGELYVFVESAIVRTGLILEHDALYCPWARSVSAAVPEVRWFDPSRPLSEQFLQHLGNFAHATLTEKGFVLLGRGRVIKAIDVDAIGGSAQPHKLERIVRAAFENARDNSARGGTSGHERVEMPEAYSVLEAAPSDPMKRSRRSTSEPYWNTIRTGSRTSDGNCANWR
jgi:hypothetical protein